MEISSRDNGLMKQAKKLLTDATQRKKTGLFLVEGARLCEDAALSDMAIMTAFITEDAKLKYPNQVKQISQKAEAVYAITDSLASFLGDTQHPQGIFCVCKRIEAKLSWDALPKGKYIALENMQDPGNLGTVIRTAEAFGADGLLLSKGCCDVENPKVLRGSMGGAFRLPIAFVPDFSEALKQWGDEGFETYACVADEKATSLSSHPFSKASICVIGNEANGLTDESIHACKTLLTIPMKGRAESLNAAVAASVVLWELLK